MYQNQMPMSLGPTSALSAATARPGPMPNNGGYSQPQSPVGAPPLLPPPNWRPTAQNGGVAPLGQNTAPTLGSMGGGITSRAGLMPYNGGYSQPQNPVGRPPQIPPTGNWQYGSPQTPAGPPPSLTGGGMPDFSNAQPMPMPTPGTGFYPSLPQRPPMAGQPPMRAPGVPGLGGGGMRPGNPVTGGPLPPYTSPGGPQPMPMPSPGRPPGRVNEGQPMLGNPGNGWGRPSFPGRGQPFPAPGNPGREFRG